MTRKRINIATYCTWKSYGSVLQAFALCKFLEELGYNATVIDYDFADLQDRKRIRSIRESVKGLLFCIQDQRSKRRTEKFIRDNIPMTNRIDSYGDLAQLVDERALFLAGSDQIWHPDSCNPFFFLRFADNCKRVSYAASMGKTVISSDRFGIFSEYVSAFDRISLRESDACEVVNQIVGGRAVRNIDPTLLIDSATWSALERPYPICERYLLVYPLYWDKRYNEDLLRLSKERHLEVVAISKSPNVFCTRRITDVDVGQFIYLIHNADAVVTSSFHGLTMSLNYQKQVSAIVNPSLPSRIESLLELLDIASIRATDSISFLSIDYQMIDEKIRYEKEKAELYLREAIGD